MIVPVYQGGEAFRQCLQAVQTLTPAPCEVIVVCDGQVDDPYQWWSDAPTPALRVLGTTVRSGPAHARNVGARAAKGDVLFFIDADVTLRADAIERVQRIFAEHAHVDAVIGSYDDAPGESNFLSQYRNLLHHYVHQQSSTEASTFWGACGAVRRTAFWAVGGFDERFDQPSVEDIDLGYRLTRAGFQIRLEPTLQIKHLKRWEALSMIRTDVVRRAVPWTKLLLQRDAIDEDLNLQRDSRISTVLIYLLLAQIVLGSTWGLASLFSGRELRLAYGNSLFLTICLLLLITLVWLNAPLYRFFQRKRGWWFALRVIPWHWLYYTYSGLGFVWGTLASYREQQIFVEGNVQNEK